MESLYGFGMGKRERRLQLVAAVFIALLAYAALSKLMDYEVARKAMLDQVFPREVALVLAWLVPVVELLVVLLLLAPPTRLLGIWTATLLLVAFSGYVLLANTGVFGRRPCGCGGILGRMDYGAHLVFNLCFVLLGCWGIGMGRRRSLIDRWFHLGEGRSGK